MSVNIVEPLSFSIYEWTKLVQQERGKGNTVVAAVCLPAGFLINPSSIGVLDRPAIATLFESDQNSI